MNAAVNNISEWLEQRREEHRDKHDQIIRTARRNGQTVYYAWNDNYFQLLPDDWDIRDHVLPYAANGDDDYAELEAVEAAVEAMPDKWEMSGEFEMYAVRFLCEVPRRYVVEPEVEITYSTRKAS